MNRLFFICILLSALTAFTSQVRADDSQAARVKAAQEYLKVVPVENMVNDLTTEMLKTVPPEHRSDVESVLKKALDTKFLEKLTLDAMPKHFTENEIKAMSKFYGTPEGASIMKKFGAYMADIMPAIQNQVIEALQPLLSGQ